MPRTFHSTCYFMPKFSTPPPRTNTLCAPLTKLSRDNIYPHCACTNTFSLHSANTVHTTRAIIMCVHTAHTLLCVCTSHTSIMCVHTTHTLLCVCTPCASITHVSLNPHRAILNLVCSSAWQYFSTRHQILVRASAHQYFSARHQILARAPARQ